MNIVLALTTVIPLVPLLLHNINTNYSVMQENAHNRILTCIHCPIMYLSYLNRYIFTGNVSKRIQNQVDIESFHAKFLINVNTKSDHVIISYPIFKRRTLDNRQLMFLINVKEVV